MESLADEQLVAAYRADAASPRGQAHLNELFQRHHTKVALWCYRTTGDREWAADLAQEVFLRVFRNLDSYRGESKFTTWLYTIARNHCLNELKARAARPAGSGEELPLDLTAPGESALEMLEKESSAQGVRRLLQENLTEMESKVMTLHYAEDMPFEAITRLLRLDNASGAKAYVVSARRKLNRAVERMRTSGKQTGS